MANTLPQSFIDRVKDFASEAGKSADAIVMPGIKLKAWSTTTATNPPADIQAPGFWKYVYNREELNRWYRYALAVGSTKGSRRSAEVQVAKMAIDYIAAAERAAHASNASRIRCTVWASIRHVGQKDTTYGPFGVFLYDLLSRLEQGVSVGNDPNV